MMKFLEFVLLALWFVALLWTYGYYMYKVKNKTPQKRRFYRELLLGIILVLPVILLAF